MRGDFIAKPGCGARGEGTVNILPHPGWVSWLETRYPLLMVWKDLAIEWGCRQLRVTRAQRATDLTLIRCLSDGVNRGKKSSKFNVDCTICLSCREGVIEPVVLK